ncbi:MAG: GNAT family N-acetyltransferase, partial [Turicibacter sp.]
ESEFERQGIIMKQEDWDSFEVIDILPVVEDELKGKSPDGFGPWLIILKDSNQVIGTCGCHGAPNQLNSVEIGYEIIKRQRQKGYATESLNGLITWLFHEVGIKKIMADCLIENAPSYQLLKKIGMIETKRDDQYKYFELENK